MVPGLFISRPEHKQFEAFWQDVLFHKPRKLEIFGFDIKEIPESIGELKGLKELMIHESYITRLPLCPVQSNGIRRFDSLYGGFDGYSIGDRSADQIKTLEYRMRELSWTYE